MKNHLSIPEFYEQFPDEESCKRFIAHEKWNGKPTCPKCNLDKIYELKKARMDYKCASCKKMFSVKTGTIAEGSKLPLQTWLLAMYIMTTGRKGISSIQLAKTLGVTQKTAWFLANRIREACEKGYGFLTKEVEIDETYIGGRKSHNGKRGVYGKQPIFGMIERGGKVIARPIPDTRKRTIHDMVHNIIAKGSIVYTDDFKSYDGLEKQGYILKQVKHGSGEYVNGDIYTNTMESFWAVLKRGYRGTFHWWSFKHSRRYVNEFTYRHNHRELKGLEVIKQLVKDGVGKRLRYRELTA